MEKGVLEKRSLREALDLPQELKDTKEIVLGAVSNLEQGHLIWPNWYSLRQANMLLV